MSHPNARRRHRVKTKQKKRVRNVKPDEMRQYVKQFEFLSPFPHHLHVFNESLFDVVNVGSISHPHFKWVMKASEVERIDSMLEE